MKGPKVKHCDCCGKRVTNKKGNCTFEHAITPEGHIVCANCEVDYTEGKISVNKNF